MDAMVFKIKDDNGFYKNRALHFAIGLNLEGKKGDRLTFCVNE
jgi:transposase-like protein